MHAVPTSPAYDDSAILGPARGRGAALAQGSAALCCPSRAEVKVLSCLRIRGKMQLVILPHTSWPQQVGTAGSFGRHRRLRRCREWLL